MTAPWFISLSLNVLAILASWAQAPGNQKTDKPQINHTQIVGPMVGHVTDSSATLWVYANNDSKCTVTHAIDGLQQYGEATRFNPVDKPAVQGTGTPAKATIQNLKPDTLYRYQVRVDNQTNLLWHGQFRTAPKPGTGSAFRLAITSCMRHDRPQTSWPLLLNQKPDLHLTLGDTQYSDTTNPKIQWQHHLRYRRYSEFASVLRTLPTYSIWDDHDFGPNNSDGTAKGKEQSLLGWHQFWANPGAGTEETPGAFYTFTRGDVQFFVVDGRYYRSPGKAPDDDKKRMLGDAQFAWLVDGLKKSTAKFKVIASGSTLRHSRVDGWRIYSFSRNRLFDAIRNNRIGGVVYASGDIHRSLVVTDPDSKRVGYPLIEVISSGVANSKTLSFATVDFDTTLKDPTIRVRIIHGDGNVQDDKTWKLSQLQVK